MIDIHCHILPGLDDGARSWEEAIRMAVLAAQDGIEKVVASPHLFKDRFHDMEVFNDKAAILAKIQEFKKKLNQEEIPLEILPGCDIHLCLRALDLLENDQIFTINDTRSYILLELPEMSFPPGMENICFQLKSRGITPVITHPERHFIIREMPEKLKRLVDLGCLVQITASSVLGGFGRTVARFTRDLLKKGYVHVIASDAHNTSTRPPALRRAVEEAARVVGQARAWNMVTTVPAKIVNGESLD
jgi:protein-tyrosine phosphatase